MIYTAATHVVFMCSVNVCNICFAIYQNIINNKIDQREFLRLPSRLCVLAMIKYCA